MARFPERYAEAVRRLPTIGETHWLKGALALNRFGERYPHWTDDRLMEVLQRTGWHTAPQVTGLFHGQVSAPEFAVTVRRAKALIARGLFPVAYHVARQWYDQEGLEAIVLAYKERAIHEGTYLGHGWTVWCSFYEIAPLLQSEEARLFALERFVEFAAKAFFGYPTSNPNWQPPTQPDPGEQDASAILDLALERPGFFGHHLLTIGYMHRHRALLSDLEWRVGLAQVKAMAQQVYIDPEDNVCVPAGEVPAGDVTEQDLEEAILGLLLRGPRDVHAATLADIMHDLWAVANERQRRHLIHYLKSFVRE
jgi:hypothetical protein